VGGVVRGRVRTDGMGTAVEVVDNDLDDLSRL